MMMLAKLVHWIKMFILCEQFNKRILIQFWLNDFIVIFFRAAFKYGDLFVYICIPIDNYYAEQQFINIFSVCFCRYPCLSTLDLCILNNVWLALQILILLHLVAIYARFSIQRHSIYITSFLRHRGNEVNQTMLCATVFDAMYSPIYLQQKSVHRHCFYFVLLFNFDSIEVHVIRSTSFYRIYFVCFLNNVVAFLSTSFFQFMSAPAFVSMHFIV